MDKPKRKVLPINSQRSAKPWGIRIRLGHTAGIVAAGVTAGLVLGGPGGEPNGLLPLHPFRRTAGLPRSGILAHVFRRLRYIFAGAALVAQATLASGIAADRHQHNLAVRVFRVLQMPRGGQPYLTPLARALAVIHPLLWHTTVANRVRILDGDKAFQSDLAAVVAAFARGADPNAVRNLILRQLTLGGQYLPSKTRRWRLAGLWDRVVLCSYLRLLARRAGSGHRRYAAALGRAALILWAQDSIQLGGGASMGVWLNPKTFPTAAANQRALSLNPRQAARLRAIFSRSTARRIAFGSGRTNPLVRYAGTLESVGPRPIPGYALAGFLRSLRNSPAIRKQDASLAYATLQIVSTVEVRLLASGHSGAAGRVHAALARWEPELVGKGGRRSLTDRAILRWIKEAVGP